MRNHYLFTIILGALCFSCVQEPSIGGDDLPVIDFLSTRKAKISELFDTVDIIPIETTENSLVGLQIGRIETFEDRIYIMSISHSGQSILCFDLDGDFIFKINRMGRGPGEYTILSDFLIDSKRQEIILFTEAGRSITLDMDGNFISEHNGRADYYGTQTILKNDSTFLVYNDGDVLPVGVELIEVDRNSYTIRDTVMADDPIAFNLPAPLSVFRDNILYSHINGTVYSIVDIHNRIPQYYINLGNEHVESISKLRKYQSENRDYNRLLEEFEELAVKGKVKLTSSLCEGLNFLSVSAVQYDKESKYQNRTTVYDKRSGRSYCMENVEMDALWLGTLSNLYILSDGCGTFYCISDYALTDEDKMRIKTDNSIPDRIRNALLERKEDDNPLLIILK
jgi:hypothetical protein